MKEYKFNVLINSRGHPEGLITTCMYLANTANELHNVKFSIRADIDDLDTILAVQRLMNYMDISLTYGPRPMSMGAEHNRMAANNPASVAYLIMNDSIFPCPILKSEKTDENPTAEVSMAAWDVTMEEILERFVDNRTSIFCWHLPQGRTGDYPIIPKRWYDAAGQIFPEYYPFWFDDQWLMAVHCMVHGTTFSRIESLMVHAPKKFVQRMRDNMVWCEHFQSLEHERVEQAMKIREAFGMDPEIPEQFLGDVRGYEMRFHKQFGEKEKHLGDKRGPDPSYLAALDAAKRTIAAKRAANEPTWYEGFEEQEPVQLERAAE